MLTSASATLDEKNNIILKCRYEDKELAKSIPGRQWNPVTKAWEFPLQPEAYNILIQFPGIRIDSRIKEAIYRIKEQQKEIAQMKASTGEVMPIEPMPIKVKPYRHQILGYNIGIKLPAAGLFMEQGCGKTLTAIAIAGRRFLRGEIKRLLIVAPASVMPVWVSEFSKYAAFPYETICLEGSIAEREQLLCNWKSDSSKLQVAIINYEATWRLIPYDEKRKKWLVNESVFNRWKPDMIIADESQRIKTSSAKQSKAMHRLGKLASYRLILTGTPVTQSPLDVFSQYQFLEPSIFGTSFYAFRNRYAIMGGYGGYEIVGYNNLQELINKVHSIAYRVTKEEALDLPEFVDQTLYCKLEPEALRCYREMQKESLLELKENEVVRAANVLAKLLRLSQITGGYLPDSEGRNICISKAKQTLLIETVDDLLDAGKKVVIFTRFIPEIRAIRKILEIKNIGYAWIEGEVQDRGMQVERFMNDPNCKVFIAQIQTGGLGITLTAADTAIFYSLSYSYSDYDQARARIHRIGQKNKCTYIHLVVQDTVDEKILETLHQKKDVADVVVDNWKYYFEQKEVD